MRIKPVFRPDYADYLLWAGNETHVWRGDPLGVQKKADLRLAAKLICEDGLPREPGEGHG